MSIHGDDELDDIDKEIKGLSEGGAENSKKTNSKGIDLYGELVNSADHMLEISGCPSLFGLVN